jgi:hypothetical protein
MYGFVESHVAPDVRKEFSDEAKEKFKELRAGLRKEPHAAGNDRKQLKDGSWQVSFRVGLREVLVGFEVDDKQRLIFLNYVKWDRFREALDWTAEFLSGDPGKKK